MPRKSNIVASSGETSGLGSQKKTKRKARIVGTGDHTTRPSYRDKVDVELLNEADRHRRFHLEARASRLRTQGQKGFQYNDFLFYYQDEANSITNTVIRLPVPNEQPRPTIDALTLTRGKQVDAGDPEYLFKLIQGHYTPLPGQFAALQVQIPLWIFCFEKTGKILAEHVHESIHYHERRLTLLDIQVEYESRCQRSKQRLKFPMEPHLELLALGFNRGLGRAGVTARDRVQFLDDYCIECPSREELGLDRHPVTSIHHLWSSLVRLQNQFSNKSQRSSQAKVDGLSLAAWRGLQEIRNVLSRHPRTLLSSVLLRLLNSESLSAEQRSLRDELQGMTLAEREALDQAFSRRARRA